jgi:hypothetical protein
MAARVGFLWRVIEVHASSGSGQGGDWAYQKKVDETCHLVLSSMGISRERTSQATENRRKNHVAQGCRDYGYSWIGIGALHEASHAVVARFLGLPFREATVDRRRVCGLAKRIYLDSGFRPVSAFALFWDLFPGVTDVEFPALGPGVMSHPAGRRHLDDWLITVLAGYEAERQFGFHGGDLDLAKAAKAASECLGGDGSLGRAYAEDLCDTARAIITDPWVSAAIDQVGLSLWERSTLTMEEVDGILGAVSVSARCHPAQIR